MKAIAIISDLHFGSTTGLCPAEGMALDDGGEYKPSRFQVELAGAWKRFFEWIDKKTDKGCDKRALVINGDLVDGVHHNTVAIATNNIMTQEKAAIESLKPVAKQFDCVYVNRGTEAHAQPGSQSDERIAAGIGAVKDESGNSSRWQLWLEVEGIVFNVAHHIGTTSSAAYESSAVMREMVAALVEAGQWGQRMPDVFVRSHRHRYIELAIPSARGKIQAVVTPGWQLRTPFVEKIDRMRMPHIGGLLFFVEDDRCTIKEKIFPFLPGKAETF